MILIAGGTGRLGRLLVDRLRGHGEHVRVLTRDPARAATVTGADIVVGDVRDRTGLTAAVAGCRLVISAVQGFAGVGGVTPESVDRDGNLNLIDAAAAAGADVVLISVVGASPTHPTGLFRMKAAAEDHLRHSTAGWTIVRATAFAELHLELLTKTAGRSGRPLVFGRGANPINFVSVDDVAAAVELAVHDTRGQVLEVGGPANLTMNELADQFIASRQSPTTDTRLRPRHLPRSVLRCLAATGRVHDSAPARQAQAAFVTDTTNMTFDAAPLHRRYPQIPCTAVSLVATAMAPATTSDRL